MDATAFNEYLEKRYYDQLKYYEFLSAKNQKKYKNFQWTLIILSTLTTILAALPKSDKFDLQYAVVVTAALVTILTSGLKTFQYQELWVNYRATIEQLKPEIYYYNFNVWDYGQDGVDKESTFVSRVEKILNKEHDGWPAIKKLQNRADKKEQPNDELQRKLDERLREKLNTQKNNTTGELADVYKLVTDTNQPQPEEITDTEQANTTDETTGVETDSK